MIGSVDPADLRYPCCKHCKHLQRYYGHTEDPCDADEECPGAVPIE